MTGWRCFTTVLLLMLIGPFAALADEPRIDGPADGLDAVEVYKDVEGEVLIKELGADQFPQKVLQISENMMLYIKDGDLEGWIFPFHVKMNFDPGDVGPCNFSIAPGEAGSRGIGKNCGARPK